MNDFIKKNKILIILGSIGVILAITVMSGFIARSAANNYLETFNEEAEVLLQKPDDLKINKNHAFVILKTNMMVKSTVETSKPSTAEKKEVIVAVEARSPITHKDIEGFDKLINDPKKNKLIEEESPKPNPGEVFAYLDIKKIGKVTTNEPGIFAKIGFTFGFVKPSELYDAVSNLTNNIKQTIANMKSKSSVIVAIADRTIHFYGYIKKENDKKLKKMIKVGLHEIKSFEDSKNQKNAVDIVRLVLIPASSTE